MMRGFDVLLVPLGAGPPAPSGDYDTDPEIWPEGALRNDQPRRDPTRRGVIWAAGEGQGSFCVTIATDGDQLRDLLVCETDLLTPATVVQPLAGTITVSGTATPGLSGTTSLITHAPSGESGGTTLSPLSRSIATFRPSSGSVSQVYKSAYERVAAQLLQLHRESARAQTARVLKATQELHNLLRGSEVADDESAMQLRAEIGSLLGHYGDAAVQAIGTVILGRRVSAEVIWHLTQTLARVEDEETLQSRRALLGAALEHRDPSVRYGAATALGEIGDDPSLESLRRRLTRERNASVRHMIQAVLR